MKKQIYLFLLLNCAFYFHSNAQITKKSEELKTEIKDISHFNLFLDLEDNELLREFILYDEKNGGIIKERGMVSENGDIHYLGIYEYVVSFSDNKILTFDSHSKSINQYGCDSDFQVINQEKLNTEEVTLLKLGGRGNFIVTDYWESYGTFLKIKSSNFSIINTIHPFKNGYKNLIYRENEENLCLLVTPESPDEKIKLFIFNSNTGHLDSEIQTSLDKELNIFSVVHSKGLTFINTFQKLIAVDNSGKILWEKDYQATPHLPIYCNNNTEEITFFKLSNEIIALDFFSGTKKWDSKSLSSITDNIPVQDWKILGAFENFVIPLHEDSNLNYSKAILLDSRGEILNEIELLNELPNAVLLINKKRIIFSNFFKKINYEIK